MFPFVNFVNEYMKDHMFELQWRIWMYAMQDMLNVATTKTESLALEIKE